MGANSLTQLMSSCVAIRFFTPNANCNSGALFKLSTDANPSLLQPREPPIEARRIHLRVLADDAMDISEKPLQIM